MPLYNAIAYSRRATTLHLDNSTTSFITAHLTVQLESRTHAAELEQGRAAHEEDMGAMREASLQRYSLL